jgi:bifunctional non-homologous end joining protein LigD
VEDVPRPIGRHARFVDPVLVAEVAFRGWTRNGLVRQGSFKGLRSDKPARQIVREKPMPKAKAVKMADSAKDEVEGVRITHPDRVLFPGQGFTKRELIDYYVRIADLMLPHIANRPISLVRCPRGSEKDCFFQKHASAGWPDDFRKIRIKEKSGTDHYLYIEDVAGLVAAVQMGVLELHIWGSHVDAVEKPDRMVFDLDPDEGLPFGKVKEAAKELRERLKKLGLESFPMATGGKGIHVVIPLARKHGWDEHRAFAEAMARLMAEDSPERYIATMSKAKRRGRIFIDYLRNQRGSTAIAPYSTRARKGAHIAAPLSWSALTKLGNARPYDVKDAAKLARAGDPWKGYARLKQTLPLSKLEK